MEIILNILITAELITMVNYIVKNELRLKELDNNIKVLKKEDTDIKSRINKLEKGKKDNEQ